VWPGGASAQSPHALHRIPSLPDELVNRPVALRQGTGRAHDAVATASKEAQAFYDQGLAYLHSFVWVEAARSFNQALRADPTLAVAHVGLTYAYVELNASTKARQALERAQALAAGAPSHDRAHVDARALQMAAEADATKLPAYRGSLDNALTAFPSDVELLLLRGIAESPDPSDRGQGVPLAAIPYFDRALKASPGSFAARHYLTHALENAGRAQDALPHAAAYAKAAPAIPHAQHMHGHVLRRIGRVEEAVAHFEAADRLEMEYLNAEGVPREQEWHYEHNLELLASSYRYIGQISKAETLLKTAFGIPSALVVQMVNKHEWPAFLTARGRTADALAAAGVLTGHPDGLVRAAGFVEAGRAHLTARRFSAAAESANSALKELRAARNGAALVGPRFEALQGEFLLRTGQVQKGRAMLESAVRQLRRQTGPDAWVRTLFDLEGIARAARDANDWPTAAWAAGEMLAHDPNYAGTHYAVGLVAAHNGRVGDARSAFTLAERYWAKADPGLPELADLRQRTGR
jgi:tetratricopeptide (TPR) repeat protein